MEREASGQGGCCGLIEVFGRSTADLPFRASASTTADIFVSRPRLAPRLDRVSPYQCALAQISLVGRRSAEPLSSPQTPVQLGLIVGSLDVVANLDVRTRASPFWSS